MDRAMALTLARAEKQYIANEKLLSSLSQTQETKKGLSWVIDDFGKMVRDKRALEKEKHTFTMVHSDGVKLHWDIGFKLLNIEPNTPDYNRNCYGGQVLTNFGGKALILCMGLKKKVNGPSSVECDIYVTLEGHYQRSLSWTHSEHKATLMAGEMLRWPVCHAHCASNFPISRSSLTVTIFVRIFQTHPQPPREVPLKPRVKATRNTNIHTGISYPENNQPHPDVTLESCDGHKFFAHQCMLRDASIVIKEEIDKHLKQHSWPVSEILFTTVPGKALKILLHYIYTRQVVREWAGNDIIHEVVDAGVMFRIGGFEEFLNAALKTVCTIENSAKLLRLANHYNLKKAEEDIKEFIRWCEQNRMAIGNW